MPHPCPAVLLPLRLPASVSERLWGRDQAQPPYVVCCAPAACSHRPLPRRLLQRKMAGEAVERKGREVRQAVLLRAQVVACTLSAAGGELKSLLPPAAKFSALIIDEA